MWPPSPEVEGQQQFATETLRVRLHSEGHRGFRTKKEHTFCLQNSSGTKNQPKEEVLGTAIPRTSAGHSRGYPGPKTSVRVLKILKNKHLGADIHDPKARTSTTPRDFQKLRSEKLWAEFSFPNSGEEFQALSRFICCGTRTRRYTDNSTIFTNNTNSTSGGMKVFTAALHHRMLQGAAQRGRGNFTLFLRVPGPFFNGVHA